MALTESWHLRSRSRVCAATGRAFVADEPIITALFPDPESSGYLRKDFSLESWHSRPAEEEAPFSFWKAVFSPPAAVEKPEPLEKQSAEEILRRLVEEDEDHTENTRYILAVMLERQKRLRETDTQRTPSGILRVYEHRKTGEVFIVKDPDLPLDQVDAVQQEVFLLLEHGGRSPREAPEEVPAGEPEEQATAAEAAAEEPQPPEEPPAGGGAAAPEPKQEPG